MDQIRIDRIGIDSTGLLDRVADGVFNHPIDRARLAAYVAQPGTMMVVARDGELVVGHARAAQHWHPDKPCDLYLDELNIAPAYRRRGLARSLIAAVETWARERGCADIWLATAADNDAARSLYDGLAGSVACRLYYWDL